VVVWNEMLLASVVTEVAIAEAVEGASLLVATEQVLVHTEFTLVAATVQIVSLQSGVAVAMTIPDVDTMCESILVGESIPALLPATRCCGGLVFYVENDAGNLLDISYCNGYLFHFLYHFGDDLVVDDGFSDDDGFVLQFGLGDGDEDGLVYDWHVVWVH